MDTVLGFVMLATLLNALVLVANVGLLHAFVKLYTEILKVEHIKRIGRAEDTDQFKGEDHARRD